MILIIGGASSGKRTYTESLGFVEEDFVNARLDTGHVLYNLQELVHDTILDDEALLEALDSYDIIICTENGSGIVPLSADNRAWRDRTGRICSRIAEKADVVVRMVCGIPTALKGELPCN